MPSSRLILNKPGPRHLLLAPHGARDIPKPPSFAVPASVGSRISINNLASTNTQPERPQTPLSQKSFAAYSSAYSKASVPHPSDDGKSSPTPSMREKLGAFDSGLERAKQYLSEFVIGPKRRLKGFWRREAKADPKRLAEFHAGLEQREAEYQALRKKIQNLAVQDQMAQEGLMSAPASMISSTEGLTSGVQRATLADSVDSLSSRGQNKRPRGHRPTHSENQELQLRAKRSAHSLPAASSSSGTVSLSLSASNIEKQTAIINQVLDLRESGQELHLDTIARTLGLAPDEVRQQYFTGMRNRQLYESICTQRATRQAYLQESRRTVVTSTSREMPPPMTSQSAMSFSNILSQEEHSPSGNRVESPVLIDDEHSSISSSPTAEPAASSSTANVPVPARNTVMGELYYRDGIGRRNSLDRLTQESEEPLGPSEISNALNANRKPGGILFNRTDILNLRKYIPDLRVKVSAQPENFKKRWASKTF